MHAQKGARENEDAVAKLKLELGRHREQLRLMSTTGTTPDTSALLQRLDLMAADLKADNAHKLNQLCAQLASVQEQAEISFRQQDMLKAQTSAQGALDMIHRDLRVDPDSLRSTIVDVDGKLDTVALPRPSASTVKRQLERK